MIGRESVSLADEQRSEAKKERKAVRRRKLISFLILFEGEFLLIANLVKVQFRVSHGFANSAIDKFCESHISLGFESEFIKVDF